MNKMIKEERKIACRLDAQQCHQECEHKDDRTKCVFVTVYPKELYVRCNRIAKNSTAPDKETPDWLETDVRQGAEMGYRLASQQTSEIKAENERLRGMVKEQFIQMFKTAGVSNLGKIDEYWQQFKTENNL